MAAFDTSESNGSPIVAASAPRPSSRAMHRHSHHHHRHRVVAPTPKEDAESQGTFYRGTPAQLRVIEADIEKEAALHPLVEVGRVAPKKENGIVHVTPAKGTLIGQPIRIGLAPQGDIAQSTATFYKTDTTKPTKPATARKLLTPGF